jgi:GR25 family glycosyltransferase involved in LPS biosynthesis
MDLQVFVINLDKDQNRLENIKKQINRENIQKFTRIPGILGKDSIPKNLEKYIYKPYLKFLPKGLVGCGVSHIKAWEALRESNEEFALFLEDDAKLAPDFLAKLTSYLKDIPKDFDIIYLGAFIGNDITKKYSYDYSFMKMLNLGNVKQVKKITDNVFVPALPLAMHGYILSKKYCNTLLTEFEKDKLKYHIDFQILKYNRTSNTFAVSPVLVDQEEISIDTSSNTNLLFPKSVNKLLYFKDTNGIPVNYKVSLAHFELLGVPVNVYFYISCVAGLSLGVLGKSNNIIIVILLALLVIDSIQFGIENEVLKNFTVLLIASQFFNFSGNLIKQFATK